MASRSSSRRPGLVDEADKFVSHTPGVELVLEAYESYWRKVLHVKRLSLKGVPEGTTRLAMLKKAEADVGVVLEGPVAEAALHWRG